MDIENLNQRQENRIRKVQKKLQAQLNQLSLYRLLAFFLSICLSIGTYLLREQWLYLLFLPILSFLLFVYLILKYRSLESLQNRIQSYASFLQREGWRITKDLHALYREDPEFPEGHYYKDLDIFGKNGLYTYLDTTVTEQGRDLFLNSLLQLDPLSQDSIRERQEAIRELTRRGISSRKILRLLNEISPSSGYTKVSYSKYPVLVEKFWEKHSLHKWLHYPFLAFSYLFSFYLFLNERSLAITAVLIFNLVFSYYAFRDKRKILAQSRKFFTRVESLDLLLEFISKQKWESKTLKDSYSFKWDETKKILKKIKKINSRLNLLDAPLVHFLANIFLFWDLKTLKLLDRLERENKEGLISSLKGIERLDSLFPFYNFFWHNKSAEFPMIDSSLESISAEWIGHPLISNQKRVLNPLDAVSKGEIVMITGSNMSGKTTYLRTIGLNVLLALCGAPTISHGLKLPPLKILSSIRNEDSLQEGVSFFYSEVKKIAYILKTAEETNFFSLVLVDEVLKGTNTRERIIATNEILQLLRSMKTFNFITTHDLDLAKGEKSKDYQLKHFVEQIVDGKMGFDYKIRNGIVNSSNALKILSIEYPRLRFINS